MLGALQGHLGAGEDLPAGDHHIAAAQGDQVAFQILELLGSRRNSLAHLAQFGLGAANLRVPVPHFEVESGALLLQAIALGDQGGQFLPQLAGTGLGLLKALLGISLALFGSVELQLAAGQQATTVGQALLQLVEFKQARAQALAHQQHQAEGDGTDQAAGEHRDQNGGVAGPQPEQAQPRLAHPAAQTVAQVGEHSAQHQQRQDQQPTRHVRLRPAPVSPEFS